jgi:copper(I)-binding protein
VQFVFQGQASCQVQSYGFEVPENLNVALLCQEHGSHVMLMEAAK